MKHEIKVPEVSEGVTEGTVVDISVAVGDAVEVDQTLLEFETDKAVIAIPSPQEGKVAEIKVAVGDSVAIGAVIMLLESAASPADEAPVPEKQADQEQPEEAEKPSPSIAAVKKAEPLKEAAQDEPSAAAEQIDLVTVRRGDRVAPAAPSVRRLARDLGVDIYQVQGTGPGGRISERDVRDFVRVTMQRITGGGSVPAVHGEFPGLHAQRPLPDFSKWGEVSREPLSRVRELTADAMGYAWSTIPMVTQYDQAQVSEIEAFRQEYNRRAISENRLTMTAILVKVCAAALKAFPRFNSSLDLASKELVLKQYLLMLV